MVEISLYFHIPFCEKKCPYCSFYVIPNRKSHCDLLALSLEAEWVQQLAELKGKKIISIYFGGGTPTLFPPEYLGAILKRIERTPDCEITIEANPENLSASLLQELRELGINRLSLGVQSLDDRSLATLERAHSAQRAKEAIFGAHQAGFHNISIDLMYDLPDQSLSSFRYTLAQLKDLPIQHLSLYNLTIEPHTSFYKRRKTLSLPDGEMSLQCLSLAIDTLRDIGLERYEISAFARKGFASRHNVGYWTGRPFLGFGPSAFSYWKQERYKNVSNLNRYARALREGVSAVDFREKLPYPHNINELLAIHLRLTEGVDLDSFEKIPSKTQEALEQLIKEGWLEKRGSQVRLTQKGTLFYDEIASRIV
jgi:oxygen-independent coproporphyrinogen-3 oxidase